MTTVLDDRFALRSAFAMLLQGLTSLKGKKLPDSTRYMLAKIVAEYRGSKDLEAAGMVKLIEEAKRETL